MGYSKLVSDAAAEVSAYQVALAMDAEHSRDLDVILGGIRDAMTDGDGGKQVYDSLFSYAVEREAWVQQNALDTRNSAKRLVAHFGGEMDADMEDVVGQLTVDYDANNSERLQDVLTAAAVYLDRTKTSPSSRYKTA